MAANVHNIASNTSIVRPNNKTNTAGLDLTSPEDNRNVELHPLYMPHGTLLKSVMYAVRVGRQK